MKYINVVVENNSKYTDTCYAYKADESIEIGNVVRVPFAKGNKEKRAYVFDLIEKPDIEDSRIKEVIGKDPDISLTGEIIETCKWMKLRYGIKYLDAIKCFVPPGKSTKEGKEKRPLKDEEEDNQIIEELTDEQKTVCSEIFKGIESGKQESFLIHGVTGSGKTEIYMQAIEKVCDMGKTAIMLVPEIALTKQITERFIGRFGREKVAILHSKLTQRERFDEWQRIRRGEAPIVIGARMAVFAPVENIGLIIMDEEHEQTYKSDKTPKYETVDVALKRVMYYDGILLMGSATPSVVSTQRAKEGIFTRLELKERYNGANLPEIDIIDMREELKVGNRTMFSYKLRNSIKETIDDNQQVILFLNRRGYSNFVSCRECGNPIICEECGISMTYHKNRNALVCHYCGKTKPVPKACPVCGSKYIKFFGIGTEQVEEYTKQEFPYIPVARLDLDTGKNRSEISRIIKDFATGKTKILVGTQLVAKGLDFKNVGLVGVLAADTGLNIPDYRSGERTFQLITQVAGRAGRGESKGKVLIQTYSPESSAIKKAAEYDYEGFFKEEISFRETMGYPPFTDLILVEFTDKDENAAEITANQCRDYLLQSKLGDNQVIFAPRISTRFKGAGGDAFRYYILIKSNKGQRNGYIFLVREFIKLLIENKRTTSVTIDVNPYSSI